MELKIYTTPANFNILGKEYQRYSLIFSTTLVKSENLYYSLTTDLMFPLALRTISYIAAIWIKLIMKIKQIARILLAELIKNYLKRTHFEIYWLEGW